MRLVFESPRAWEDRTLHGAYDAQISETGGVCSSEFDNTDIDDIKPDGVEFTAKEVELIRLLEEVELFADGGCPLTRALIHIFYSYSTEKRFWYKDGRVFETTYKEAARHRFAEATYDGEGWLVKGKRVQASVWDFTY